MLIIISFTKKKSMFQFKNYTIFLSKKFVFPVSTTFLFFFPYIINNKKWQTFFVKVF